MYDSRIGRFLSVDPLTASYPWYTPYQFAGNQPIVAIDLDGLEPKYMIKDNGKLTKPVITFMEAAFNYEKKGLQDAKWYKDSDYISADPDPIIVRRDQSFKRAIKRKVVDQALSTHGLITISTDEIVYRDKSASKGDQFWMESIGHEQSHVQDYLQQGEIAFYIDYGLANLEFGYLDAPTEALAYEREGALKKWLPSNTKFVDAN